MCFPHFTLSRTKYIAFPWEYLHLSSISALRLEVNTVLLEQSLQVLEEYLGPQVHRYLAWGGELGWVVAYDRPVVDVIETDFIKSTAQGSHLTHN